MFEGVVSMSELNSKLLSACTDQFNGYDTIRNLLAEGAEPLGSVKTDYGEDDNLYGAIVDYYSTEEDYSVLYEVTKLFCQHGMDLTKPAIPYDDANILNPVWYYTILMNDGVLPILKYLLDNGLDIGSAHTCWYHAVEYWFFADGSMGSDRSRAQVLSDLKKILLIASYPYVLDNDDYLREIVWLDQNDYDITKLRDWNKYHISVDHSRYTENPHVCKSLFTIIDNESGQAIWRIAFGLKPNEI